MNIVGIIPARMASSRYPGKPLAKIHGIPMVGHVYFRSKMCPALNEVYVATCDKEIAEYVESIGGNAVMTADTHERASDRTAEAMVKIEAKVGVMTDIAVMIQGDEPLLHPDMVDEALGPLFEDATINITNLMAQIKDTEEFEDPNVVKVVVDKSNNALYFSREPIPSRKKGVSRVIPAKQICVVPFRRSFLLEYTQMEPTALEIAESVDMMRIVENGLKIRMVFTRHPTVSVDTKKDLNAVTKIMARDELFKRYHTKSEQCVKEASRLRENKTWKKNV